MFGLAGSAVARTCPFKILTGRLLGLTYSTWVVFGEMIEYEHEAWIPLIDASLRTGEISMSELIFLRSRPSRMGTKVSDRGRTETDSAAKTLASISCASSRDVSVIGT